MEPDIIACWQVDWLTGWLADEIWVRLEILKACCRSKYSIFCFV